jgi:hypothetical protein
VHNANVIAFRGEHGPLCVNTVCNSRQTALYFSTRPVAVAYATSPNRPGDAAIDPRILKCGLSIKSPFIYQTNDAYLNLSDVVEKLGEDEAFRIAKKFKASILQTAYFTVYAGTPPEGWEPPKDISDETIRLTLTNLYFQAHHFFDDNEEVVRLVTAGYDGAVHRGCGESAFATEYCVFSETSIYPQFIEFI